MDLTWDWPCGVAYYGISEAYENTGNEDLIVLIWCNEIFDKNFEEDEIKYILLEDGMDCYKNNRNCFISYI